MWVFQISVPSKIAVDGQVDALLAKLGHLNTKTVAEVQELYNVDIAFKDSIDRSMIDRLIGEDRRHTDHTVSRDALHWTQGLRLRRVPKSNEYINNY